MSPRFGSRDERLCSPAPDYAADAQRRSTETSSQSPDCSATAPGGSRTTHAPGRPVGLLPETSAKNLRFAPIACWVGLLIAGCVFGVLLDPHTVVPILNAILGLPFLSLALLRGAALVHIAKRRGRELTAMRCADVSCLPEILPTYAVLVPLFKEAEIIEQLVEGLCKIDYPVDRLQISLIVEEDDTGTQAAIARHTLPDHMRLVVVPQGEPRTKPRALNHALADASGAYVVVYDAEDLPNPGQLREALAVLVTTSETTGCVQARLNIYNADRSAISRQFAIEYNALFGAVLPTLDRLGLPIPLGGTSNHFPRRVLEQVGGWDPYNVTEDADLGIRLARLGYEVRVISSTTWEEAPETLPVWIRQRTRWLKGWMQTYLVHLRQPRRLWRELGTYRFLGFQMMLGGMILSALGHPLFLIMLCYAWLSWDGMAGNWLAGFGLFNLMAGYVTAMALGVMAVITQNRRLAWSVLAMPVYWVAISFAAYRALWHLISAPYFWETTPHYGRKPVTIRDAVGSPIDVSTGKTARARHPPYQRRRPPPGGPPEPPPPGGPDRWSLWRKLIRPLVRS